MGGGGKWKPRMNRGVHAPTPVTKPNAPVKNKSIADKVGDSILTFLSDLEFKFGAGYGFGGSAQIGPIEFSGVQKCDLLTFTANKHGIDLGRTMENSISFNPNFAPGAIIGYEDSQYYSYLGNEASYFDSPTAFIGLSASAYAIGGGTISIGYNLEEFSHELYEIWW